jgi:hypothetical protein
MANHCEKKKCADKCKRYDSWSESNSSCDKPKVKKYERQVTVTEVMYKQNDCRRACKKSGYKVKCESSWKSVPCEAPVCEKKCEKKPVVCKKKKQC